MSGNYLFSFGLGYCAYALSRRLQEAGFEVAGTCRDKDKQQWLLSKGIRTYLWSPPGHSAELEKTLTQATHLLISIPPGASGDVALNEFEPLIVKKQWQWVGYLSTTGVYGDHLGGWVDETTPVAPNNDRLERRVMAENQWLEIGKKYSVPIHIFRLAGIYGPGRSTIDNLRDGTARRIIKPGQYFTRIHVEDVAGILEASIHHPTPSEIYNVCDDEPAPSHEVVEYAAGLLGVAPPPEVPFEQAKLSEMGKSFYSSNRRVRNDKIKEKLAYSLRFPTYREGLASVLHYKAEDSILA